LRLEGGNSALGCASAPAEYPEGYSSRLADRGARIFKGTLKFS
jgi:hypothetical protein